MHGEGFEPTEHSHVSALNACSRLSDLRKGKQIHGRIYVGCLGRNVFVSNALIDMYAKCGEIDRARWLFDRTINKNVVSWNSLIAGYLKNGQPRKCIDLFQEMQVAGFKPDDVTVSNALGGYCQIGLVEEASKVFSMIKIKDKVCWTTMIVGYVVHGKAILLGVDNDLLVCSALVDMYCKCGITKDASVVFDMMPSRNVVSWNAMIRSYEQNGQDLEALAIYKNVARTVET
ncbi:Detected protein of confused Function [Hibiscus syriacus]|uniref:Detected protein of confused Function n=1 Tax=Hibiscus syriacus TaxID=106335 RepID=A0A6A2ZAL4_HIBSY|nr:Detected protein of confused Function [Hibiscus syriacus]